MTKIINKMILFAVCGMAMSLSAKDELPGGLKRAEWMHASMSCPKCDGRYCAYYDRSIPGSRPTACPKCSGKKDEGCIYPGDLYRQAQRALRKGNISEALAYLEKSAANGNAEAQFDLGCFHAQGEYGLKADIKKAVYYWTLAARNNHADAQCNLGDCYMAGDGVKQNSRLAFEWWQVAADNDHIFALYNVANCYADGEGIPKNAAKANELYKKLLPALVRLARHDLNAVNALAKCYYYGLGTTKDYKKAVKFWKIAAENQHPEGMYRYACCCMNGEGTQKNPDVAVYFMKKAAEQQFPGAAEELKKWGLK